MKILTTSVSQMASKILTTSLLFSVITSLAFSQGRPPEAQPQGDWKTQLGIGTMIKPKYEGSSNYDVWPIPFFDFEYKESLYISPYRGIGYKIDSDSGFSTNIGLGFDFGRDEEDGDLLVGMGDIDFSGGLRVGVDYDFGALQAGLSLSKAVTGAHDGYEAEATLGKSWFVRSWKSLVRVKLSATFSSEEYMQTYFGVDAMQSQSSGHPVYLLDGGLKDVGVSTTIIRRINPRWSLLFLVNYSKFVGDVVDSPVVESDHQFFGGVFAVRSF